MAPTSTTLLELVSNRLKHVPFVTGQASCMQMAKIRRGFNIEVTDTTIECRNAIKEAFFADNFYDEMTECMTECKDFTVFEARICRLRFCISGSMYFPRTDLSAPIPIQFHSGYFEKGNDLPWIVPYVKHQSLAVLARMGIEPNDFKLGYRLGRRSQWAPWSRILLAHFPPENIDKALLCKMKFS